MATAQPIVPSGALAAPPARPVESRDPATGEVWRRYTPATREEVRTAVEAARRAQPAWAARPLGERAAAIERFRRLLLERRGEVADVIVRENGKPEVEALAEIMVALDLARFNQKAAHRTLENRWFTPANVALWRKRIRITHEPYGVVGCITPWNYPFMLAAGLLLPALVAGNAVLLKPSEFTPTSGKLLVDLFHEAGVPPELVHFLPGAGATGAALVEEGVDKVFFIGSERTGRIVNVACAQRMIPCVLELGGSDPAIVLEDADVRNAARGVAWGRFSNGGQTCVAPKRVFVVDAVYDRFMRELSTIVERLRVGPASSGAEVGPLIRPEQVEALRAQYTDALDGGAEVVARSPSPEQPGTGFFPPTVIGGVRPEMRVLREETFGPLLPVARVRDAEAAIAEANATSYGLSASIWSRDIKRASRLARRIHAGTVAINDVVIVAGIAEVPHGGVKASGSGRSHGVHGLLECVQTKTIVADRLPSLRQPWWYGYSAASAGAMDGFIAFLHGGSPTKRLGGAWRSRSLLKG